MTGMVAPMVLDGPINGEWLEADVGQMLVRTLRPDDVMIMDTLSSHKRTSVRTLIEAAGVGLLFLPPYGPDFNMLRKVGERTVSRLWSPHWQVGRSLQAAGVCQPDTACSVGQNTAAPIKRSPIEST